MAKKNNKNEAFNNLNFEKFQFEVAQEIGIDPARMTAPAAGNMTQNTQKQMNQTTTPAAPQQNQ